MPTASIATIQKQKKQMPNLYFLSVGYIMSMGSKGLLSPFYSISSRGFYMYQINFHKPTHIYFCGIGGISMSGLAEILLDRGFEISGSDMNSSALTQTLEKKGARIFIGQSASNITPDIDCVIFTSAIHADNPEYRRAQELGLATLTRAELLGQLMLNYTCPIAVSGTHGKTTTTSMLSEILLAADTDPTVSVGGILDSIGGNIRIGKTDYFVTEACEYTNSFLSLFPKVSVILNIEEDHLDFFRDLAQIRDSFQRFAELLPDDGLLVINKDIDHCEALTKELPCKVVTFGSGEDCDYHATDFSYDRFGHISAIVHTSQGEDFTLMLSVPGEHNLSNALAAVAVADHLGIDRNITLNALQKCKGSRRRFEYKGALGDITIIDDYAHHPTEITATLTSAQKYPHARIWCVFQPHTFTRTKAFMDDFAHALTLADKVVLADIYPARETDDLGISSKDLQAKIQALGKECFYFSSFGAIENFLLENLASEDMLITMGAGDIVRVGEKLLGL